MANNINVAVRSANTPLNSQHEGFKSLIHKGLVLYPYAANAQIWVPPTYDSNVILTTIASLGSNTEAYFGRGIGSSPPYRTVTYTDTFGGGWSATGESQVDEVTGVYWYEPGFPPPSGLNPNGYSSITAASASGWPLVIGNLIIDANVEGQVVDYSWSGSCSWASSWDSLQEATVIPPGAQVSIPFGSGTVNNTMQATIQGEIQYGNGHNIAYFDIPSEYNQASGSLTSTGNTILINHIVTLSTLRSDGYLYVSCPGSSRQMYYVLYQTWFDNHFIKGPGWSYPDNNVGTWDHFGYGHHFSMTVDTPSDITIYYHPEIPGYYIDDPSGEHVPTNLVRAWDGQTDVLYWTLPTTLLWEGTTWYYQNSVQFPLILDWTNDDENAYILTHYWKEPNTEFGYASGDAYAVLRVSWADPNTFEVLGQPFVVPDRAIPNTTDFLAVNVLAGNGFVFVGGSTYGSNVSPKILSIASNATPGTSWTVSHIDWTKTGSVVTLTGTANSNRWYAGVTSITENTEILMTFTPNLWFKVRDANTNLAYIRGVWAQDERVLFAEYETQYSVRYMYSNTAGADWYEIGNSVFGMDYGLAFGGVPWQDYILFPINAGANTSTLLYGVFNKNNDAIGMVIFDTDQINKTMDWGGPWIGTGETKSAHANLSWSKGSLSYAVLQTPDEPQGGMISWAELQLPAFTASLSWAELVVPFIDYPRGWISFAELVVPSGTPTAPANGIFMISGSGLRNDKSQGGDSGVFP